MSMQIRNKARGFSLIEVMIAVLVLSFGLLALAALQGELFRAGAEAKARANATTLAQQVIEDARAFAFVAPPSAAYTGATYQNLTDGDWTVTGVGGVEFTVDREVVRYRYNRAAGTFQLAAAADPFQLNIPEYKLVRVSVTWAGGDGTNKTITLTDSIAAVSPSDITQVMDEPNDNRQGPSVYIEPPNKGNPQVVPIAIGPDQAAASSNPTPEQFVEDVSAVTRFSVMSFTGSGTDEVLLTRKLDMAAASCVCQDNGGTSSATNPAYQATTWNGKSLRYVEPAVVTGSPVGAAVVSNADSEIETLCTICCRDHHVYAKREPDVDPWRASVDGDSLAQHYGYKKQGSSYNLAGGLLPSGDTGGLYLDACQLTRVSGRMRMMVDADQTAMVMTPLNDAGTSYRNADFVKLFSGFVTEMLTENMNGGAMPTGYPSPSARFPAPSATVLSKYSDIIAPPSIALTSSGEKKTLVSFGVYVDYLTEDTLEAYECALLPDNDTSEPDCAGLTARNPLEVLPFYAVNVASLGDWTSQKPLVAAVETATYDNQGRLATPGGVVTAGTGSSTDPVPVTLSLNRSNSGLAGTAAIDKDDAASSSYVSDLQGFTKAGGSGGGTTNNLVISVGASSSINLKNVIVTSPAGGSLCNFSNQSSQNTCVFTGPATNVTVQFSNYTEVKTQGNKTITTDRKVCFPADARILLTTVTGDGTAADTVTITLSALLAQNYNLVVSVIPQADTCAVGELSLTPNP